MTPELAALAATAFIHLAAVLWSQRALEADVGRDGNTGPRDGVEALMKRSKWPIELRFSAMVIWFSTIRLTIYSHTRKMIS